MTAVPTCYCRHARQVHEPTDDSPCRGHCFKYGHVEAAHIGPCTARCICQRYRERAS